jgi:hypothetical protein
VANNITIKDGGNNNVVLHTIEDASNVHFNQSIPTDINNNVATVVSGGQAVASGMGALVVAQRDALPAGTNHLGKVSVVGVVSIQQTGALFTQAQGQYLATPPTLVDATVSTLQVDQRGSLRVTIVSPNSDGSIGKTSSFTDGNVNNQNRIPTESYPMVFNRASSTWDRLTGTSVGLAVTQAGTWNVGLNAGTALVGAVSISPNGLNIPVSIAGTPNVNIAGAIVSNTGTAIITFGNQALYTVGFNYGWDGSNWRRIDVDTTGKANVSISNTLNIGVSVAPPTFNLPVSVHPVTQSGTWNVGLNAGTNLIGRVSTAGLVSVWNANTGVPDGDAKTWQGFQNDIAIATNYVYNRASNTWDRMTGTSVGLAVLPRATYNATAPTHADATVSVLQMGARGALHTQIQGGDSAVTWGWGTDNVDAIAGVAAGIPKVGSHGKVFNRNSSTWDLMSGTSLGLNVVLAQAPTFNVPVSAASTGFPNGDALGLQTAHALRTMGAGFVYNKTSDTWDRMQGTSVGLYVQGNASAGATNLGRSLIVGGTDGTNNRTLLTTTGGALVVHVSNTAPGGGAGGTTQLVSVGGAVSTQGVQIVGRDGSGNARVPYVDASGIARVSIEGALTVSGSSMTHTVGAAVTTEGYPMLGSDGANSRRLLTTTGGALVVHISNALPAAGASMLQTVGAAVTTQGYPMLGTDGTNARIIRTDTLGRVSLADTFFNVGVNVALPAGTNLIGAVSISPNGLNIPVSIAQKVRVSVNGGQIVGQNSLDGQGTQQGMFVHNQGSVFNRNSNTWDRMTGTSVGLAVTQGGTWNVGLNAGTNLVGAVSISPNGLNIPVSLAPPAYNLPVSVHPVTQSGTWNVGLNAGTNLVGAVSISPNGLNIPVSVANTINVNTHAVTQSGVWNVGLNAGTALIGAVSISPNGLNIPVSIANTVNVATHAVTQSGTWNIGAISSINSIVRVSIEGTFAGGGGGSMTQTVGVAVTNQGYPMLGSDGTNARRLLTTTGGALVVHVSNSAPGGGAGGSSMTHTVGSAVTTEGYPMLGSDGANSRRLLTTTGGALVVHISNALPAAGASMLQTVGAAVTTQGYPMLGTDGTNARGLLTTTGGALVVHVSNTAPGGGGGGGGGTVMASIGGAVSNQAVQIAGSDTQNNARTIKTNVSGAVFISTRTFMSQYTFARPANTTAYSAGTTAAPGAAGDLIANDTTAASVIPLKFRVARSSGQNGGVAYIRGARMYRTGGTAATGQHNITGAIRLHLFNTNNRVSVAGGDNAAMNASPVSNWMGYIDLVAIACAPGLRTSGAVSTQVYWGSPARTGEMLVNLSATQVSIQGLLETRVAFTPNSGEIFTVQIEGFNG